jgi:hypothetical protein
MIKIKSIINYDENVLEVYITNNSNEDFKVEHLVIKSSEKSNGSEDIKGKELNEIIPCTETFKFNFPDFHYDTSKNYFLVINNNQEYKISHSLLQ